jgi:hypothetical protein
MGNGYIIIGSDDWLTFISKAKNFEVYVKEIFKNGKICRVQKS